MKEIINFNHISEKLDQNEIDKLKRWFKYYHKLYTCYKWKYKRLKGLYISLKVSGIALIVIGGVAGAITLNPIV